MTELTVYVTPKEPPVTKANSLNLRTSSNTTGTFTFYIRKRQTATASLSTSIIHMSADYILTLWMPQNELRWERDYHELIVGYKPDGTPIIDKVLHDAIRIYYPNLSEDKNLLRPYWRQTTLAVRTPGNIIPHSTILYTVNNNSPVIGHIPLSGSKDDFWGVAKQDNGQWYITLTPIVRPGEYIEVRYNCAVNGVMKSSAPINIPYETPLFTGGWIRAKKGFGLKTRYDVEIFGTLVTDIMPTDFYNYEVDKWVYLMKVNSDIPLDPPKVDFDSSKIELPHSGRPAVPAQQGYYVGTVYHPPVPMQPAIPPTSGNTYRIVPIDFGGQLSIMDLAVSPFDALSLDSAQNFAEVFDMKNFTGHAKEVTTSNILYSYRDSNGNVQHMTSDAFNYCPNSTDPAKGTNAIKEGDTILISQGAGTTTPKVLGVPKKLCPCTKFGVIISTVNGDEAFAWDLYNNKVIVEKTTLTAVQSAISNLGFEKIKECLPDTEIISEPLVATNADKIGGNPYIINGMNKSTTFNLPLFGYGDASENSYPHKMDTVTYDWSLDGGINVFTSMYMVLNSLCDVDNLLYEFNDLGQPLQPQPDVYDYSDQSWFRHKMINKPSYLSGNTYPTYMEKKGTYVLRLLFTCSQSAKYAIWDRGLKPTSDFIFTDETFLGVDWSNSGSYLDGSIPYGALVGVSYNDFINITNFTDEFIRDYESSTGATFIPILVKSSYGQCGNYIFGIPPNNYTKQPDDVATSVAAERRFLFIHSLFDCDKESDYYNDLEFANRAMCRISKKDRDALLQNRRDILRIEKEIKELNFNGTLLSNNIVILTEQLNKLPKTSDAYIELQSRISSIQASLNGINSNRNSNLSDIKVRVSDIDYLKKQSKPLYDSFKDADVRDMDSEGADFDFDCCGWKSASIKDWIEKQQEKYKSWTSIGIAAEDNDYVLFESVSLTLFSPAGKKNGTPIGETSSFTDLLRIWTYQDNLQNDEFELMELINSLRTEPLHYNKSLEDVALRHAKDMMLNPYIKTSSTGSDNSTLKSRIEESTFLLNNQYIDHSVPYNLWTTLDIGKVSYIDVNAIFLIKSGQKTPADIIASIDTTGLIQAKYTNIGIGRVENSIGDIFLCIVVAQNEDTWAGLSPVDTAPILDYIDNNFSFTNSNASNTKIIDNNRNLRVFMIHTPMPF